MFHVNYYEIFLQITKASIYKNLNLYINSIIKIQIRLTKRIEEIVTLITIF